VLHTFPFTTTAMLCERPSFPFPLNPTPAGTSLIVVASSAGHAAVVEYLADRGADLTARNATFLWNALFAAAAGGHADVVEVLLARGIDTSALDFEVRRRETTTGCEHGNTATAVVRQRNRHRGTAAWGTSKRSCCLQRGEHNGGGCTGCGGWMGTSAAVKPRRSGNS